MTETLMPGGGVARRPLHFIVMADCSGSMKGEKMQALNYALRSMLPHLVAWERDQIQAQLLIRILRFATEPQWHVAEPLPVADLIASWRNLEYVYQGRTNMGAAFREVSDALGRTSWNAGRCGRRFCSSPTGCPPTRPGHSRRALPH